MNSERDNKNVISYDVNIDDSTPTIDIEVETDSSRKRSKLDTIINVASKVGYAASKVGDAANAVSDMAKARRAAKIQAAIDKIIQENPGYSFLIHRSECEYNYVRRDHSTDIYYPVCKYSFFNLDNDLLYYAEIPKLVKQNIRVLHNGVVVSEIIELKHAMKGSDFKIIVNGRICGNLVRATKEKGIYYYFNNWKIKEYLGGIIQIHSQNGDLISKAELAHGEWVLQYLSSENETLIATLVIAAYAYHNSEKRRHNRHSPYEHIFSGGQ